MLSSLECNVQLSFRIQIHLKCMTFVVKYLLRQCNCLIAIFLNFKSRLCKETHPQLKFYYVIGNQMFKAELFTETSWRRGKKQVVSNLTHLKTKRSAKNIILFNKRIFYDRDSREIFKKNRAIICLLLK